MALEFIQHFPPQPDYKQTVTLDGVSFQIRLWWCDRNECWYADLAKQDGTILRRGAKLNPNWPLFRTFVSNDAPQGILICVALSKTTEPITRDNLGKTYFLAYVPKADVLEYLGGTEALGIRFWYYCNQALVKQIIDFYAQGYTVTLYG